MSIAGVGLMAKTMVGSLLPIVLSLVLAVISYMSVGKLESSLTYAERSERLVEKVMDVQANALEARAALNAYMAGGEDESLRQYKALSDKVEGLMGQTKEAALDRSNMELLDAAAREFRNWRTNVADPAAAGRGGAGTQKEGQGKPALSSNDLTKHFARFRSATADLVDKEKHSRQAVLASVAHDSDLARKAIVILALAVIVAAVVKNYILAGRTTRPLLAAVGLAEAIGRGDLRQSGIEVKRNDEVGRLSAALNKMIKNLKGQALRITESVSLSASSTERISATVSHLASSTSKTAAALSEATATVEQVRQAAKVSTMKAKDVAAASQEAVRISDSGLKAAEDTARKIHLIDEQMQVIGGTVLKLKENAQAIDDVIVAIRDLADQSKLLAVNASIEAARAGEQGKGFGVVAHEIKVLSDGSKEAVSQVRKILEEVGKSIGAVVSAAEQGSRAVAAGVTQSEAAGSSIGELADRVMASAQAAGVIEVANEQQFAAVDQVANAMAEIQQAVQENLEGTSQLESAVRELNQLNADLKQVLKLFHV